MNITIIILGVVVLLLLYVLYVNFTSTGTSLSTATSLKITNADIAVTASPQTYRYAYGVWLYVNSWDNTAFKPIFSRPLSTTNTASQIYLYLDAKTTTLFFNVACATGYNGSDVIVTDNFPLQKWVYFTVSVDNQYIDLYLDGKLVKSIKISCMAAAPGDATTPIKLGSMNVANANVSQASDIFLAKLIRWTNPLNPQDVWNNYMAGNGGNVFSNLMSKYGLNVAFTSGGVETSKFKLF